MNDTITNIQSGIKKLQDEEKEILERTDARGKEQTADNNRLAEIRATFKQVRGIGNGNAQKLNKGEAANKILALMKDKGRRNMTEIQEETGIHKATTASNIKNLVAKKMLRSYDDKTFAIAGE